MTKISMTRSFGFSGIAACLALAGACRTVAQPGPSTPPVSDTLGPGGRTTGDGRRDLGGADASARPSGARADASTSASLPQGPRWGRLPEDERGAGNAGLYTVLDGACGHIGVSLLQNETVITFGNTIAHTTNKKLIINPTINTNFPNKTYKILNH